MHATENEVECPLVADMTVSHTQMACTVPDVFGSLSLTQEPALINVHFVYQVKVYDPMDETSVLEVNVWKPDDVSATPSPTTMATETPAPATPGETELPEGVITAVICDLGCGLDVHGLQNITIQVLEQRQRHRECRSDCAPILVSCACVRHGAPAFSI